MIRRILGFFIRQPLGIELLKIDQRGGMTREDAHLAATVAIAIIFGIIVGVVVTIVLSSILTVEAMAPTAAEVMAADFSLEHKLAEAAP